MSVHRRQTEPRGNSPFSPGARVALSALLLLLGAGCGDSLLGSFGLSQNLGIGLDLPDDPAWTMRWYGGPGAATVGSCASLAGTASTTQEGFVMTGPSPLPTPLATVAGDGFTWSLGIPLVTDGSRLEDVAGEPLAGIWGVAPFHAVFVAEGDLGRLEQELQVGSYDGASIQSGAQWVELFLNEYEATDLVGAIVAVDQDIEMTQDAGAVPVESLDIEGFHAELIVLATGSDPLAGLVRQGCD